MSLRELTYKRANDLYSVGYAVNAIGNLLGADGSEHHINDADENGLHHALLALGALIGDIGGELCEASEPEESAPRNAGSEIVARNDSEVA